ncbi:hypothetical protein Btru_038420 [Bulinus truncatus]|nr:hypothetical protein Btru_038420 [Bulinus truncatus]
MSGIKDVKKLGDVVVVYFEKINRPSICYSIAMTREAKVARSQKNFIRTYEYHEPSNQATVFYQPKSIRDATIKDICSECLNNQPNMYI